MKYEGLLKDAFAKETFADLVPISSIGNKSDIFFKLAAEKKIILWGKSKSLKAQKSINNHSYFSVTDQLDGVIPFFFVNASVVDFANLNDGFLFQSDEFGFGSLFGDYSPKITSVHKFFLPNLYRVKIRKDRKVMPFENLKLQQLYVSEEDIKQYSGEFSKNDVSDSRKGKHFEEKRENQWIALVRLISRMTESEFLGLKNKKGDGFEIVKLAKIVDDNRLAGIIKELGISETSPSYDSLEKTFRKINRSES